MVLDEGQLLEQFGRFATSNNASVFVGAGLSRSVGYPDWSGLLEQPLKDAHIPGDILDLTVAAQYCVQNIMGGRAMLDGHILATLAAVSVEPSAGHRYLAKLPVEDVWTTNYDCLLEAAMPQATVLAADGDLAERRSQGTKRIIKMHGSLTAATPVEWRVPPIITRQDYETYAEKHPRMWSLLTSTYLTRSMLFLGFSFNDPNIGVLLRLSRTLSAPTEHFTVLRAPSDANERRHHDLQVADLEQSGVAVHQIGNYDDLDTLLLNLERRTRRQVLFISGSESSGVDVARIAWALGMQLAETDVSLSSLSGPAALKVCSAFGKALAVQDKYAAERVRLFFRRQDGVAPPPLPDRIGTVIYSGIEKEPLRAHVLNQARATVVIGGGQNTLEEAALSIASGVPAVPIARSGGAAMEVWKDGSEKALVGVPVDADARRDWDLLNHAEIDISTTAAKRLIKRAMFLSAGSVGPLD